MKAREGERQEAQPYQCLRGDPNSFKNIQGTYTHRIRTQMLGQKLPLGHMRKDPVIGRSLHLKGSFRQQ